MSRILRKNNTLIIVYLHENLGLEELETTVVHKHRCALHLRPKLHRCVRNFLWQSGNILLNLNVDTLLITSTHKCVSNISYKVRYDRSLLMHKVTCSSRLTLHIRPWYARQIPKEYAVWMQHGVRMCGVNWHMLLGKFVATSHWSHSLHPCKLNVLQSSSALQELGRCRIGKHIAMGAGVDDHERRQAGNQEEKTSHNPCTATDRASGFTLELCGFILRALQK